MDSPSRRNIHPMNDWRTFLIEGEREFHFLYSYSPEKKYRREDFLFFQALGKGAFGHVYLSELRITGKQYAIKMMEIYSIVKAKQVKNVLREKRILQALNFPFCIHLEASFRTLHYIYMCLPYVPGGNMLQVIHRKNKFDEESSKFYGAQVLLALEYLHHLDIVHRDIKPENVLLDTNGYIKLTDFGLCKILNDRRTYTFCGTPQYAAPEIILRIGYGKCCDWWSFGIFLYEMTAGYNPFQAGDTLIIFEKIINGRYEVPDFFSPELTDLIKNLIQIDLTKRYGNLKNGVDQIKYHTWFSSVDWNAIFNYNVSAPYIPPLKELGNYRRVKDVGLDLIHRHSYAFKDDKEFEDF